MKNYKELSRLHSFEERFEYLKLCGKVGKDTFGFDRIFNQMFYSRSAEWRRVRDQVIIRDNGCDLGMEGHDIYGKIIVHHMNPISLKDIQDVTDFLLNPDYLICVSHETHNDGLPPTPSFCFFALFTSPFVKGDGNCDV